MTTNDGSHLDGLGAVEPSKRRAMEPTWKDGRSPDPSRMCTARRTNGEPCRRIAVMGAVVCPAHGGSSGHVKAAARVRIERAADRVAKELLRMAVDDDVSDAVKLSAINSALDRAGLSSKTAVEVSVGPAQPWQALFDGIGGGSRAESRAARGIPDEGTAVLDAEVVGEDMHDGADAGTHAAALNQQAPQPDLDTASHRQGGSAGASSGTNPPGKRQSRGDEMRASGIESRIVSLAAAHPEDEPPRRIRTNERNRAITPKMTNGRKKRRRE